MDAFVFPRRGGFLSKSPGTVPSALPSDFPSTDGRNRKPKANVGNQESPLLDEVGMLTLLLRVIAIINNKNGDCSLRGFQQNTEVTCGPLFPYDEADLIPLEAVSAILVQQHEIIAAGYQKHTPSNVVFGRDRRTLNVKLVGKELQENIPDDFGIPLAEHPNPPRFEPKFTITANPRSMNEDSAGNFHNLRHVKTGEDDGHWPDILSNPECRMIKGPTSLEEHISTVCAYLNDYRSHPSVQSDYSNRFFKYLLTVCWPKLYRRISSWRGLGFIYRLYHCQFNSQIAKDANWGDTEYDMAHEKHLRRFLSEHDNVVNGLSSVFEWLPVRGPSIDFQALAAAAKCGNRLYTRETANEFHHFVFAAFVMFGHSLSLFGKAVTLSRDCRELNSAIQQLFYGLQAHTTLILYLTTSSAFAKHMEVFQNSLGLQELVPDFDQREEYKKFGESMKIKDHDLVTERCSSSNATPDLSTGASNAKANDKAKANDAKLNDKAEENGLEPANAGAKVTSSDSGAGTDAPGNVDSLSEESELEGPPEGLSAESFIGWLKTFIVQFIAKRVLELQCRKRPGTPVEMSLLAVDRKVYRVPPWTEFQKLIQSTVKIASGGLSISCATKEVVPTIEKKIEDFIASDPDVEKTMDIFRTIINSATKESKQRKPRKHTQKKPRLYTVGSHSETLLGMLMKFGSRIEVDDPELAKLCAGLHDGLIGVSKLCCPICWHVLGALRQIKQNELMVRGCHSNMYGLVLPPFLSDIDTADSMNRMKTIVNLLKCELLQSICDLVKPEVKADPGLDSNSTTPKRPTHQPKQESVTSMEFGYDSSSSSGSLNDVTIRQVEYPLEKHMPSRVP
ncbi:hypothetical protein F5887DRAFT_918801 [Amanita rubescens]|nr:hypothetical protein F5887DRAFT_918801 [Amanita rubescens]